MSGLRQRARVMDEALAFDWDKWDAEIDEALAQVEAHERAYSELLREHAKGMAEMADAILNFSLGDER